MHQTLRLLLVISTLFVGCSADPALDAPVILITIDTLRSDHLPAYGYRGVATPNIDALRGDSILYQHAYSHSPLTLPSHATIFTGLLPSETGVRDNIGFRLRDDVPTLAGTLKTAGYGTGAAVSASVLDRRSGIHRGFDYYDDDIEVSGRSMNLGAMQRTGDKSVDALTSWIDSQGRRPFFAFLHLYEPHSPYEPPEPYRGRYPSPYDGEIAHVDAILGRFIDHLKSRDLYDRAIIILLSDHGEGLRDHGEAEHGMFLYREAIQVPLLLKLPSQKRRDSTVTEPVQLSDVFPTIVRLTLGKVDLRSTARSLLDPEAGRMVYSETFYPRFHFGWSELHSMIDGRRHLIEAPAPEYYDLSADPGERRSSVDIDRRRFAAMRTAMKPLIRESTAPEPIDPEEMARLAALGYLGSVVQVEPGERLPDPKDRLAAFDEIQRAFALMRVSQYAEALALMVPLLEENGRMVDLWMLKGQALTALGRPEEAIEASKQGLRISPSNLTLAITVAELSLLARRFDDAESHAQLVLRSEPAYAHDLLSRIALARGDLAGAEKEAKEGLRAEDGPWRGLMNLARVEKERGDYVKALSYIDQAAAAHEGPISRLHFLRGDVLARLGRSREAEREFLEEISLFPDQPETYKNLIVLYVGMREADKATATLFQLVENVPTPPGYLAAIDTLRAIGDHAGVQYWAQKGLERYPENAALRRVASTTL